MYYNYSSTRTREYFRDVFIFLLLSSYFLLLPCYKISVHLKPCQNETSEFAKYINELKLIFNKVKFQ